MRVVVTGAAGFIGTRLVEQLAAGGHEVVALDRAEGRGRAEWVTLDLSQPLDAAALPGAADAVVHLAQSPRYREFPDGAGDMFAVNVRATADLLDYARGAGATHFVLASSGGVYKRSPEPLTEDSPLEPEGFYLRSKLAAEVLAQAYEGLFAVCVMRPFFVYGPGQRGMLVPALAERVLAGDEVAIEGRPGMRTTPTYVDDAARAFAAALELKEGGAFNVAGPQAVSLTELVEAIAEAAGREPSIRHRDGDPGDLVGDTTRMREVLGVAPEVALRDGLAKVLADQAVR